MLRFYSAFAFVFLFLNVDSDACGFNFVGDCSTGISLKINGTQDSFAVAPCPGLLKFDGFMLGSLQSLSLVRAKATTWESCQNNVSGVSLFYRVFEQGFPGGMWHNLALQEDYSTLAGPYTTRYRSVNTNTSLTTGLVAGKTYVLEIYFLAEVDTIGDDFIPETTLLQNNNGQNYHFAFQYGGASAPPFVVATTKIVPVRCPGDSTGVAGVSVYGNQSGLFYQWSTGGNNYWILSKIPAGVYTVTVTGAGGYAASDTIEITQPLPLSASFAVSGPGCDGAPGQAKATCAGGTAPYHFEWSDGQQDSVAVFPAGGDYALTVIDGNGCSVAFSTAIPPQPIVNQSIVAIVCAGETYAAGDTSFSADGLYAVMLPGANGNCDTLLQLTLIVSEPPPVWLQIKEVAPYNCSGLDPTHIVIEAVTFAAEPVFEWIYGGEIISTADTCNFVLPAFGTGLPTLPVVTVTDQYGCSAQTGGFDVVIPQPPALNVLANAVNPDGGLENGVITLLAGGGIPPYSVHWENNDTTWTIGGLGPGTYCATVSDARGCTAFLCVALESSGLAGLWRENILKIAPNPACAGGEVEMVLPGNFAGQEVRLEILDLQGQTLLRQTLMLYYSTARVRLPENLPAGTLIIGLNDADGNRIIGRFTVH